jgi:putative N6-adenine-specific DNA methylase
VPARARGAARGRARDARATDAAPTEGGVAFGGPLELALHANLESRFASRILWQVARGPCRSEDELYRLARSVAWPQRFKVERALRVDVAATRSPLASLEYATLKVKDAVCDRFRDDGGRRPSIDKQRPDVRVHAYLTASEATLYLDTSGEALFKRGWRREADGLAARTRGEVVASPGARRRLDPMCGSGTIAIERRPAADRAPGLSRSVFRSCVVRQADMAAHPPARARPRPIRAGSARDLRQRPRSARARAVSRQRAGRGTGVVAAGQAPVSERHAGAPGVLVANPPYRVRLDDARTGGVHPRLGDALKQRFAGWTACLLSGDRRLATLIGLKPSRRTPLMNGDIECRLYRFEIVAGRPARPARTGTPPQ